MKKFLTLILALVISVVFTVPAFASSFLNGWNGGEKLNFSPVVNQNAYTASYWSQDLVNKYGLTWYESPTRFTLKGEVMLLQLRTIQAALRRQGYPELNANGQTLTNFIDTDSLVYSAQEEAKILKSIGILPADNNLYMNMDYYSTRAEVAKMITAANQSVLGISAVRIDNAFTDTTNHWAKGYISYAYQIGVMDGVNSSMFYPDNAVSIEQLLDIMDNEVGHYGITTQDVATAMNETFKVTCNLNSTKISPEYTSYNVKTYDYTQIKVNTYPYTSRDLEFTSYDASICQITSISQYYDTVTVRGLKTGSTYIKVNLKDEPSCYAFIPVYVTDNQIPVTGITVDSNLTLEVGTRSYVTTSVFPYNATNKAVQYYSSDSNIASVNSSGRVTGVNKGVAVITAQTNNGYRAYCTVNVTNQYYSVPATGITVTNNLTLEVANASYVTATVLPYSASDKTVLYYSNNNNVASVNSDGKVTGISRGVAVITAQTNNGYKAYCTVTVTDQYYFISATGITVNSNVTLEVGGRDYLTASVLPYNATDKTITYYSGDTNIVSVNGDGRVTGVNRGTTVVTAQTNNGYKAYCTVTVNGSNTNPTNNGRNFMYVNGYGESSYYNAFNNESMTFMVDTYLAINSVTLNNTNCYISQGVSSNANGWQFTVKSLTLSQNGETLLTVTLSNGEQLNVRICIYP